MSEQYEFDFEDGLEDNVQIGQCTFVLTCNACPEQYDVFIGSKLVGYVRLRWNTLRANYPDVMGKTVYTAELNDWDMQGVFETTEQRDFHLRLIAEALEKEHEAVR
jgi:hypothetical protein